MYQDPQIASLTRATGQISSDEYETFFKTLLAMDRQRCSNLLDGFLDRDISTFDLYVHLFQRALHEIGRKWELAELTVADEHAATAIVENLMSTLYPKIFQSSRKGRKALISCVEGEYHQIAAKMVADVFEMEGWDGIFVGGNTPHADLVAMSKRVQPDIIGISVSLDNHLKSLDELLPRLKLAVPDAKLIVGGQALLRMAESDRRRRFDAEFVPSIVELRQILQIFEHRQ